MGWRFSRGRLLWLLVVAGVGLALLSPNAGATVTSHSVAYVFDDTVFPCSAACGMNDTSFPGASIFTNAVTGTQPGTGSTGSYTPSGGSPVTLTNVPLSTLDSNAQALSGFDTAILYQLCNIGGPSNQAALAAINAFVNQGGKLMIFDADGCAPSSNGTPDWSGFVFPFATNNPGPQGASGSYSTVEASSLTTGLSPGPVPFDAVGDANVFTTFDPHWFQAVAATNTNGVTGTVMAYARAATGGLALYSGEDFWFTDGASPHLQQVFDDMLNQQWSPDNLPGTTPVCSQCTGAPISTTVDDGGLLDVSSFTDPSPLDQSQYSATIDWGDGQSSSGSVVAGAGSSFDVFGSHTYLTAGSYQVTVSITRSGLMFLKQTVAMTVNPAHYHVELKAWIPVAHVVDPLAPYPVPAQVYLHPLCQFPGIFVLGGTVMFSQYRGDNHAPYPGGYRVLSAFDFDWNGHNLVNASVPSYAHYGTTHLDKVQIDPLSTTTCVDQQTATSATSGAATGATSFSLSYSSANPLQPFAPTIDGTLRGTMSPSGTLSLSYDTDLIPSHGIQVTRDGIRILQAVVNDASCLGSSNLTGATGLAVFAWGLTHEDDHGSISVPAQTPGSVTSSPDLMCSGSYWATELVPNPIIATASRSLAVRVAAIHGGRVGRFIPLNAAVRAGLVSILRVGRGLAIVSDRRHPVAIKVLGGAGAIVAWGAGKGATGLRFYGPIRGPVQITLGRAYVVRDRRGRRLGALSLAHGVPRVTVTRHRRAGHLDELVFQARCRACIASIRVIEHNHHVATVRGYRLDLPARLLRGARFVVVDRLGRASSLLKLPTP